ncbi:MAG: PHB depolymerase family esterase [Zoogloeaceae bacterium]|nr:PHB depolymerase family esterase [Zoogloeaceae bacterium]
MRKRRADWIGAWFRLARQTTRAAGDLGRASVTRIARDPAVKRNVRRALTAVATPTAPPASRGRGAWHEGSWGLGPLAQRSYRLFIPPGARAGHPLPLVVLLHGCGQDAAAFAAATRAAAAARAGGFAVLLPEQSTSANPQRCWNWFRPEPIVAGEAGILLAIVDHVCRLHHLRNDAVFAIGLSAGGAMAMVLGLAFPERFRAVASHSGAVPLSARTPVQGTQAMIGQRGPRGARVERLRRWLGTRHPPPLLLIHGDADLVVNVANAEAAATLWCDLGGKPEPSPTTSGARQRGRRRLWTVSDYRFGPTLLARVVRVAGLGHAWSGGAAGQAFSDPTGPDALRMAWGFFSQWCD